MTVNRVYNVTRISGGTHTTTFWDGDRTGYFVAANQSRNYTTPITYNRVTRS